MTRARIPRLLPAIAVAVVLALPAASLAAEHATSPPAAPAGSPAPATPAPATSTSTTETSTIAIPAPPAPAPAPQLQAQPSQGATPGAPAPAGPGAKSQPGGSAEAGEGTGPRAKRPAPAPSTLTPALPLGLQSSIAGVPGFFIESFQIPPFLLPIFQAAGTAYGIPWQVLAAINEVETDYGRDLSVSSAGAEGWMQFLPAEWAQYGVDANGDGFRDPYNPADVGSPGTELEFAL